VEKSCRDETPLHISSLNRLLLCSFRQIDLASGYGGGRSKYSMSYLAAMLIALLLTLPAMSVALFRYRYQDRDGGEYEAVFETDEQVRERPDKEKAEEIADGLDAGFLPRTGWNDRNPGTKDYASPALAIPSHRR
jgi:hypothetical protein